MVENDMLDHGYDPHDWHDVLAYWRDKLDD